MENIKYNKVDETVFYEKLDNGIEVYMYPIKGAKNFYMTFNVRFGSLNTEFKYSKDKNFTVVPQGTAHFLEHQLFMEEDGTAFEKFAELGSSVNAFTTYDLTCYEVIASENLEDNLNLLLDFVQNPIFKQSNVNKEKSVIKEEIKMYDNIPGAVLNFGLEYNLNVKDRHKYLISGTESDVVKVDAETLYAAYDVNYQPQNMFIIITGNFKPHEVMGIIKENQLSKEFEPFRTIKNKEIKEPNSVFLDYEERNMNVNIPKVKIAFKYSKKDFEGIESPLLKIYLDGLLYLKFGPSSDLTEKLKTENLTSFDLSYSYDIRGDYIVIFIDFESPYKEEIIKLIEEEISSLKLDDDEIKRLKNINKSNFILHFNDLIGVCESLQDDIIHEKRVVNNMYDLYDKLNKKEGNKVAKILNSYNVSIFVINKENQV